MCASDFQRYGSARKLYNFHVDNAGEYSGSDPRSMTEFDTLGKARDDVERRAAGRGWRPGMREGAIFNRDVIHEIQRAAREGIYDIRGFGAKRPVPHFDDLLFLGASMSRYPLEGYRERCDTDVTLGARHAKKPLHLDIPITIAGMSFGALSGAGEGGARARRDARWARAPPPATAA